MSSNNFSYYRIVSIIKQDKKFFIGFANKCVCGRPPNPCVCRGLTNSKGHESGDICFTRWTYMAHPNSIFKKHTGPTFDEIVNKILPDRKSIICGIEVPDTGKYKSRNILKWFIPKKQIKGHRNPSIESEQELKLERECSNRSFIKLNKDSRIPEFNPTTNVKSTKSTNRTKTTKSTKPTKPPYIKMKDTTIPCVFSEASGGFVPKIWKSDVVWGRHRLKKTPLLSNNIWLSHISKESSNWSWSQQDGLVGIENSLLNFDVLEK